MLAFVREPARRGEHGAQPSLRVVFGELGAVRGVLIPLVLGCALMSVGDFAMQSWSPALLGRRFGMSAQTIGVTRGPLIIVAGALASLGGGALSDRFARNGGAAGRLRLALIASLIALPFALIALAGSQAQVLAAVTLWMLFSTGAGLAGITALQEIVPNRARGLGSSFIAFGNILIGLGGGAALTGFVTDRLFHDPQAVGRSLTLVILPATLIAILFFRHASRQARSLPR